MQTPHMRCARSCDDTKIETSHFRSESQYCNDYAHEFSSQLRSSNVISQVRITGTCSCALVELHAVPSSFLVLHEIEVFGG